MTEHRDGHEYAIVPNLVTLVTNVDRVRGLTFCSEPLKHAGAGEETSAALRVRFLVVSDDSPLLVPPADSRRIASAHFTSDKEEALWYVVPVAGGKRIAMVLKNLGTEPLLAVNRFTYRFLRFPVYALLTPGMHLSNVICAGLLQHSYAPLHAACVRSPKGDGVLITALANTGKTTTTFQLLNKGFSLVAEDIAIVDGSDAYCCPLTATYTHSPPVREEMRKLGLLSKRARISLTFNDLARKFPIGNVFFMRPPDIGVSQLLDMFETTERTTIRYVLTLRKGHRNSIGTLQDDQMVRELMQLNHFEFLFWRDPLLLNYGYCYPDFEPQRFVEQEQKIISSLVGNSNTASYIVECVNPEDFPKEILRIVGA